MPVLLLFSDFLQITCVLVAALGTVDPARFVTFQEKGKPGFPRPAPRARGLRGILRQRPATQRSTEIPGAGWAEAWGRRDFHKTPPDPH